MVFFQLLRAENFFRKTLAIALQRSLDALNTDNVSAVCPENRGIARFRRSSAGIGKIALSAG
jgi:hypothetical protein